MESGNRQRVAMSSAVIQAFELNNVDVLPALRYLASTIDIRSISTRVQDANLK